jgi:ligand-binding sensor domain-containing protein/AraC-like DNA-binding protein
MNRKFNILVGLILMSIWFLPAQEINYSALSIESGLSNNYIRAILKDSQGLMWFGTDTGLDSYDGLHVINYAKRFKTPLKGAVQSLAELREGELFVGTSWGAFLYYVHENRISPIIFDIPDIDVRSVFISSKGNVYFASDHGLFVLDWKTLQAKLKPMNGKTHLSLNCITEDAHGTIWVAGKDGLFKIEQRRGAVSELPIKDVRALTCWENILFIGTLHGLRIYTIPTKNIQSIKALDQISILSLTKDRSGKLFIGTDNAGVYMLPIKTRNLTRLNQLSNFNSKTIFALNFDASGMLWVGTFDSGAQYVSLQKCKKFNTIEFENSRNANIRSLYLTPQGEKYVGTRNGSLLCLDSKNRVMSIVSNHFGSCFRSDILTTIFPFPGKPNLLLLGTFGGGITVYNKNTRKCNDFSAEKTFQTGSVYKFCTDKQGHLWIATLDGLFRYNLDDNSMILLNPSPITGSNEVFTLHSDNKDKIWIGTKTGACYYSLSSKKFVQPTSCKSHRFQCTSTFVDTQGNSWFCFNKGGVLKLDKNLNEQLWLTKEVGLPENAPNSLVEDPTGNIWIGTSKGLFRVNRNNEVHAFGQEDGLTGIGFCPESAAMDHVGSLWWSNEMGLVTYLNDSSALNNKIPPIKFTYLTINGDKFDVDTLVFVTKTAPGRYAVKILGKSNNNLEFRVVALSYQFAGRNQYSYFLEGVNKYWSVAGTEPSVAFNHLKPGSYLLKIKASNNDGVWTPIPIEIRFSITPYFYETILFLVLITLMAISLLLYFTRSYILRARMRIAKQLLDLKYRQSSGSAVLKINEQKSNEIKDNLLNYMQNEKPWLNCDLRLADVAVALGYPVHEISQVLNVQLNQNFSDFINSYRVEEVKVMILGGETQKYTLTAIAMQCGFNAKSSFQRAFKKATDCTPSDYLRNHGKNSTPETNKPS